MNDPTSKKQKLLEGIQTLDLRAHWNRLRVVVGTMLGVSPAFFTWFKLLILTPSMGYLLWPLIAADPGDSVDPLHLRLLLIGFGLFLLFDFLRKSRTLVLYQHQNTSGEVGSNYTYNQLVDRISDFPFTVLVAYTACQQLNPWLLWGKIMLDMSTLSLSVMGKGPERTKLRTVLSETLLFALLSLSIGWAGKIITVSSVSVLLGIHIAFNALVLAFQLGLLQKRFIADALSFSNLLCGCASMHAAQQNNYEISLLYLLLGAAFDGFDGAAARKFGGTPFGVYSDDIADGVNYGIAPGFALYMLLGGNEGLIIGIFYSSFTISRLIFFTLNKEAVDPNYFSGIPSPVGGMIVMSSIVLFVEQSNWVCFLVGIACTQMVSFSTYYRHLGRALSSDKKALFGAPVALLLFLFSAGFWGVKGAAVVILCGALLYGFLPSMLSFIYVMKAFITLKR